MTTKHTADTAASPPKPRNKRRWVDPLIVHDDIRFGTATFRPIDTETDATGYTIAIAGTDLSFTGPTLYAAAETARLHHQQLHGSTFPPIYRLHRGTYTWWAGQLSTTDADIATRIRPYIAKLANVSVTAITVAGPPTP